MSEFLGLEELRKVCQDNNLIKKIIDANNIKDARKIIEDVLPDGKKAKPKNIKKYIEELNEQSSSNESNNNQEQGFSNSKVSSNASSSIEPKTNPNSATPSEDNKETLSEEKQPFEPEKQEVFNKKYNPTESNPNSSEKITGKVEGEKDAVYIGKDDIKKIDSVKDQIEAHKKSIEILKNQLENVQAKLKVTSQEKDKNNLLSQIPDLNELLNSSNEKITVAINKELLSKATRFVDTHALIRLENIIKNGYDLNSTVVQSILLAFIHQNSLL